MKHSQYETWALEQTTLPALHLCHHFSLGIFWCAVNFYLDDYGIPQTETPDEMVLPFSEPVFASGFAVGFGA